jgi:hypothetical protein
MAARELDAWADEWGRGQADNSIRAATALRVVADRLEGEEERALNHRRFCDLQTRHGQEIYDRTGGMLELLARLDADIPATPPAHPGPDTDERTEMSDEADVLDRHDIEAYVRDAIDDVLQYDEDTYSRHIEPAVKKAAERICRIRSLPSPSPGGDPGVLVEALERFKGRCAVVDYWIVHEDEDETPRPQPCGKCDLCLVNAALESWRRSPERTARLRDDEHARQLLWSLLSLSAEQPVVKIQQLIADTLDAIQARLEADRRNRP